MLRSRRERLLWVPHNPSTLIHLAVNTYKQTSRVWNGLNILDPFPRLMHVQVEIQRPVYLVLIDVSARRYISGVRRPESISNIESFARFLIHSFAHSLTNSQSAELSIYHNNISILQNLCTLYLGVSLVSVLKQLLMEYGLKSTYMYYY